MNLNAQKSKACCSKFRCFFFLFFIFSAAVGMAQGLGGIRGMIQDKDFAVPLAQAKVTIVETGQELVVSETGSFAFQDISPGSYTLMFSKSGYARQIKSGVVVSPGAMSDVDMQLAGEIYEMDEFVVQNLELGGASEIGLLNLRMDSTALMDSVGAEMMSKAGASDAAQALQLVPGATVQDGKYAVVRGLPDRYVVSLLSGVRLPSADPDKRAVQLDQYPAQVIESIQITKTFTPDQQADSSGGTVDVELKGIPDERILSFSVSTKYDPDLQDADGEFYGDEDRRLGAWGHDAISNPGDVSAIPNAALSADEMNVPMPLYKASLTYGDRLELGNGFEVGWYGSAYYGRDASSKNGVDDSYLYQPWSGAFEPETSGEPHDPDDPDSTTKLYDTEVDTTELAYGTLASIGLSYQDSHNISLMYLGTYDQEISTSLFTDTRGKEYYYPGFDLDDYNSSGNQFYRVGGAANPYDPETQWSDFRQFELDNGAIDQSAGAIYQSLVNKILRTRETATLQFKGDHTFDLSRYGALWMRPDELQIDWAYSDNSSSIDMPDRRSIASQWEPDLGNRRSYNPEGGRYDGMPPDEGATPYALRTWRYVEENNEQQAFDFKIPFKTEFFFPESEFSLSFGYFADDLDREYRQDSFGGTYAGQPRAAWDPFYYADYHDLNNTNFTASNVDVDYDGSQRLSAAYYSLEVPVLGKYGSFYAGQRFEQTDISTTIVDADSGVKVYLPQYGYTSLNFKGNEADGNASISESTTHPSLILELKPLDTVKINLAYSETLARMTFKELAPIDQREYFGDDIFIGNPTLKMSEVYNWDGRLDYTPYPGGLISVSLFKKEIINPIEYTTVLLGQSTLATTAVNYPKGYIDGFECELRQNLGNFFDRLEGFVIGANYTKIQSEVHRPSGEISRDEALFSQAIDLSTRPMLNAPEFLYNLNLSYEIPKTGTELALFYSAKGKALLVGGGAVSSEYRPDIYEDERGTLNFSLSQRIFSSLKFSLKIKNITQEPYREIYYNEDLGIDQVRRQTSAPISFSIGLSGNF